MAVGIEQLAGPVSPGDIIMKNEQAPRGAAALLNKMVNKNTQGMYKLPEPEKEMPGFMKDAMQESEQAAVDPSDFRTILKILEAGGNPADYMEQVKLDSSDFRTILKLLEQGFSMEDIQGMTQASMTKDGPTKGLTMKDIANLDQAAVQGGKINFLGQQPEVKAPVRAQSHADSPPTELAYITDAEKDLLIKANIHGSLEGKANEGPSGIQSLDDFFNTPGGGVSGGSTSNYGGSVGGGSDEQSGTSAEDYGINPGMAVGGGSQGSGTVYNTTQYEPAPGQADKPGKLIEVLPEKQKALEALAEANRAKTLSNLGIQTASNNTIVDLMKAAGEKGKQLPLLAMKGADALADFLDNFERQQVEDLFSGDVNNVGFGMGSLMRALESDPDRADAYFDKYEDEINTAMGSGEKTAGGDSIGGLEGTAQEKINAIVKKFSGNKNFDKNYDPKSFYETKGKETTAEFQKRMREKGVTSAELAEAQQFGKIGFTRANTQMIEEGRRRLQEQNKGSDKNKSGGGSAVAPPADTPAGDMPEPDPRAGDFNVGGDMPYTSDRTGGVEMNVPLGRRFQLTEDGSFRGNTPFTMDDVMKYATKGGFQQLEPFQEYLTRRKKFLGEEDPEYFDEEGNVIYGGPQ